MTESPILLDEPAIATEDSLVVTPVSERLARLAATESDRWTADDLSLYIREESERLCGPQLPCHQESLIVTDFLNRFGARGISIARAAYEIYLGRWMGAPITIRRFSASNDKFFAEVILGKLDNVS